MKDLEKEKGFRSSNRWKKMNFKFGLLNVLDSLLKAKRLCCDIEIVTTFISCVVTHNWALKAKRVSQH